MQEQMNNYGAQYQTGQEQAAFSGWVQQQANTYAQQDPQYFPAAQYAANKRINFWKSIGPQMPAGLAEKLVEGESILVARIAQQYGGQFAPAIAQLAREWGYAPAQPQNGNGATLRQPAAPSPQAQRLQQVAQGQRVQGLGAVPAAAPNNGGSAYRQYSPADIAQMSEREFMQAMANPNTARDLRYAMARAEGFDSGEAQY
jgi:hypothetical protein